MFYTETTILQDSSLAFSLARGSAFGVPMSRTTVYTIGHSSQPVEQFIELLVLHHIDQLVDVRSAPYSRWVPHFNREALAEALRQAGIRYVYGGKALGGRPDRPSLFKADGKPDYAAMALTGDYRAGIDRLLELASNRPTAIMCSEGDFRQCHRHWLIEPTLLAQGARVLHIEPDGSLTDPEEIEPEPEQLSLFELDG